MCVCTCVCGIHLLNCSVKKYIFSKEKLLLQLVMWRMIQIVKMWNLRKPWKLEKTLSMEQPKIEKFKHLCIDVWNRCDNINNTNASIEEIEPWQKDSLFQNHETIQLCCEKTRVKSKSFFLNRLDASKLHQYYFKKQSNLCHFFNISYLNHDNSFWNILSINFWYLWQKIAKNICQTIVLQRFWRNDFFCNSHQELLLSKIKKKMIADDSMKTINKKNFEAPFGCLPCILSADFLWSVGWRMMMRSLSKFEVMI